MAIKYLHKFASTAAMIAAAADRSLALGLGAVSNIIYANIGGTAVALIDASTAQTLTNKTITGPINTDIKALAADLAMTTNATLADITGFSFPVIAAGVYRFRLVLPAITMTTNGGLKLAFKLTTATLTAVQLRVRSSTDTDNTGAVSVSFATATDQATWVAQNAVVYTNIVVDGYIVVNAAGTVSVQAAQNASHADTTTISKGATVELTRLS